MNLNIYRILLGVFFQIAVLNFPSFAATPPVSQQMSGQERSRELQSQSRKLQQQVEQVIPAKEPAQAPAKEIEDINAPKTLIKQIDVTGGTLFPSEEIRAITSQYEGEYLTFWVIQSIADQITDLYRKNGFITSRAYIPPQNLEQGVLEIRVIEATVGNVQIKGNRYFSTRLINRYVTLETGEIFNYGVLKNDLERINDHPDRDVKALLVPGSDAGSTDVVLDVTDRFPMHVTIGYDNGLSYYLRRNAYTTVFTHNNLLGRDDILQVQYDRSDGNDYYHYSGYYMYPLTKALNAGFSYSRSKQRLGRSLADTGYSGESTKYSFFTNQKIVKNDNLAIDLVLGFDYKNVDNYILGDLFSRDHLRVPKAGVNLDLTDGLGRTVISNEVYYGVPGIMGGTKKKLDAGDIPTSRAGADGEFFLDRLNILRLQRLPNDSTLLWKNQFQFSSSILTSTEQFQAGGPANNRGFEPAEAVGDNGYSMNWELAIPPYFMPKQYQIPFLKTSFYNAFRFIGFYDWSNTHLNATQPGQKKNETLSSAGCGAKLILADHLYASYEVGWPIQGRSEDGKSVHHWLKFTITF